jgi:predicted nucleic acid-binding protein
LIIDTDVIIWHLRGNRKAKDFVSRNIPFNISVVTYMEIVQGMKNKRELTAFLTQLKKWSVGIIQITPDISVRSMLYVEEFFLSHSMELADALIAATVVDRKETLLTANDRHYRHISGLQIMRFSP